MRDIYYTLFLTIFFLSLFSCNANDNKKKIDSNKVLQATNISLDSNQKTTDTIYYYQKLLRELNDNCLVANKIRANILEYINNETESIYDKSFISLFPKINAYAWECSFPRNNEETRMYFYLGEVVLLNKAEFDERAMKLVIDLYLVNRNNVELSEYYGFRIIPKIALKNISSFIKVLSNRTEKEAIKCINKLKYIDSSSNIEKIKNEIDKIDNEEYLVLIDRIKEMLPSGSMGKE